VLWLLNDGVVAARAGVPGYPAFQAAIEMSDVVPPGASAADLRRAVNPYLTELLDRAAWMMLRVIEQNSELSSDQSNRLMTHVLKAAHLGLRAEAICDAPLLPTVAGGTLSVNEIAARAEARGGLVRALEPREQKAGSVADPASTLVISGETRAAFTELTGLRFQIAAWRRERLVSRIVDFWRDAGRWLGRRWRALWIGPELDENHLDPGERRLLAVLREEVATVDVRFVKGSGKPAFRRGALLLGRSSRFVEEGSKLVADNPAWRCAVSLSLGLGACSSASRSELRRFLMRQ
jgi:hypothetical protein